MISARLSFCIAATTCKLLFKKEGALGCRQDSSSRSALLDSQAFQQRVEELKKEGAFIPSPLSQWFCFEVPGQVDLIGIVERVYEKLRMAATLLSYVIIC
jgi:hypothetical protein